jgi:hypothetical protein
MLESASAPQRYLFIDLYRSAVILLMLEGHVLRTFLPAGMQQTDAFQLHEFFHGLSAPAFLFGAGLTFVISTKKRWEAYHHWGKPLARRVKRLLLVLLLGLALHLPYFSLRKIVLDATGAEYLGLFQFDVLHCIGIGLLSLHALIFFFKTESKFYGLVFLTIIAVCFLTPLVWDVDWTRYLPAALAQMFNGGHGSPFPLFPFAGFLYAGVIVSWEFLVAVDHGRERQFMRILAMAGAGFVLGGLLASALPVHVYPAQNFWFTSPAYFFIRAGILMLLAAGAWLLAGLLGTRRAPKALVVLGIESLMVYVVHLLIVYGSACNPSLNLRSLLGTDLTLLQTGGVFLGLTLFMLAAALVWNRLKEKYFHASRLIQLAAGGAFLYYFFIRDF